MQTVMSGHTHTNTHTHTHTHIHTHTHTLTYTPSKWDAILYFNLSF